MYHCIITRYIQNTNLFHKGTEQLETIQFHNFLESSTMDVGKCEDVTLQAIVRCS